MSITEDLINFDIIESHKENIQSLPGGRSAKALVSTFAPSSLCSPAPTIGNTRNFNDAIRQEYEVELIAISDSDDPLDIYDRYVKWTLNAYPSAQATPESQLRPLLERATKAFQSAIHYKNDPRYLKLWLIYIRFFSDTPRETFAYLARHSIGEGLALFYEEFAAWLEGAGRWAQADEVYKLGIEREARPTERLVRKFGEFQHRLDQRTQNDDEPSSPALPTVRPALVAKIDPFASTPRPADPQARPSLGIGGPSTARGTRQKLSIFADADVHVPVSTIMLGPGETAKGWENIGSIAERKKENDIEAKPWSGETLKAGKKVSGPPKMMVFKDESVPQGPIIKQLEPSKYTALQEVINPKTGKVERVFVNLEAVYPNPNDHNEELSFEELRAKSRGWLDIDWAAERRKENIKEPHTYSVEKSLQLDESQDAVDALAAEIVQHSLDVHEGWQQPPQSNAIKEGSREGRTSRTKRTKIMEVKGEPQTIKTNLESPTGPKLKRKNSAEPTMTLHTKAATDDILDIFNQPLRNMGPIGSNVDSAGESDYDDDDYTSAGESTGTGRISGTSEYGDEETSARNIVENEEASAKHGSEWSDFTASEPGLKVDVDDLLGEDGVGEAQRKGSAAFEDGASDYHGEQNVDESTTQIIPEADNRTSRAKFIPIPLEDYEPPSRQYRDSSQPSQGRLQCMTPIVEKTESSMGALTARGEKDYFNSKTPSRRNGDRTPATLETDDELLSSPFEEIVSDRVEGSRNVQGLGIVKTTVSTDKTRSTSRGKPAMKEVNGPIIKDTCCNPVDDSIRQTILESIQPPLAFYAEFHDYRPQSYNKGPEIRKFVKALAKVSKNASEKTATNLSLPPILRFTDPDCKTYTIKRELGKGAFAPVYLASHGNDSDADSETLNSRTLTKNTRPPLSAIKCEDPPTPWEFHIMRLAHLRLGSSRPVASIAKAYELHLFADEGYLIEEYHDQGTLLDLVNLARAESTGPGVLDEAVVMFFAIELIRTVEALHAQGLLHGDLKADNCLVRLDPIAPLEAWDSHYRRDGSGGWSAKGLCLIDFGRGIDMRCFKPGVQFIADWKTGRQDCVEMREMRPWTWQVDYWGVAGVVHSLLFGKYIEDVLVVGGDRENGDGISAADNTAAGGIGEGICGAAGGGRRWKVREGLKRYWQGGIWGGFFDTLLNSGGKSVDLRGLRRGMEDWLEGEEGRRRGLRGALRRVEEKIRERRR